MLLQVDGQDVEVLPKVVNEAAASILLTWERLGKPRSVFSTNGSKLLQVMIATWRDLYPVESSQWLQERAEHLLSEMSIKDQIKGHTGRSLASIPLYLHKLMKLFFKDDILLDRAYYMKLVKLFPMFRMANKV